MSISFAMSQSKCTKLTGACAGCLSDKFHMNKDEICRKIYIQVKFDSCRALGAV